MKFPLRLVNPSTPDGREVVKQLRPYRAEGVKQILAHPNDVQKTELTSDRAGVFLLNIRV